MDSLYACKIAVLPVGRTSLAAHARFVVSLLAAEGLDVPLGDVPLESGIPSAPLAAERGALSLELELGVPRYPDTADADACLASRSVIRGVIGLCDGGVHAEDELLSAIRAARAAAQRIHRGHGPPGTLAPSLAIFVFRATEQQLERAAAFGPDVRFVTSAASASDPSLALHLRVLVADFSASVVRQLDAEASALQRLEDSGQPPLEAGGGSGATAGTDSPATSAAPSAASAPRSAPPAIGSGGLIDLGLSSGLGSFGLALGALRKRWAGRVAVRRAEVLLCLCAPLDALDALDRAGKALRASAPDALFLGFAELLRSAALVQRARYFGRDGRSVPTPPPPAPFLPDAAAALRDAIAFFDSAAALPDVGGASDAVVQLALGTRLMLARYIHTRPPDRALASLAAVAGCAEDELLTSWASGTLPEACLAEPSAAAAAAHALEAARFTAAALIPGDPSGAGPASDGGSSMAAFLAARMKKASAAAAGVAETVKTAVVTAAAAAAVPGSEAGASAASGASAAGLRVAGSARSPALPMLGPAAAVLAGCSGGGDRAAALAEAVDLVVTAASRAREIRSVPFQARALLQCAELFEAAGLWRRSDACASRASRLLRALQVVPTQEDFIGVSGGAARCACVYETLLRGSAKGAPDVAAGPAAIADRPLATPPPSDPPLWPQPWIVGGTTDAGAFQPAHPSALLSAAASWPCYRPAVAAALLLLSSEARDASVFSAMTAHNPACAANAGVRATTGGPAAPASGPRILLPPPAHADWAQTLIADFWQCGELPLAAEVVGLSSHLDQQGRRLRKALPPRRDDGALHLPPTTRALLRRLPSTDAALSSPSSTPVLLSPELTDQLLAALLRRRALLSVGAAAIALRSPRLTLRAILTGTTVPALQGPADSLVLLKVLAAFSAEDAALASHGAACAPDSRGALSLAEWRPPPSRGLLDALQGPLCVCLSSSCLSVGACRLFAASPPPLVPAPAVSSPEALAEAEEQGPGEAVWASPAEFGSSLAAYLIRCSSSAASASCSAGPRDGGGGGTDGHPRLAPTQQQVVYAPSIPCFPLEVLSLEWRLQPGAAEALLALLPVDGLAGHGQAQGGLLLQPAAPPHGRPARTGRRVYDEIGGGGARAGSEPPPLARSRTEVAYSPEASACPPVALALVVRLRNTSALEVSGAFAAIAVRAATHDSPHLPEILSWESVAVLPRTDVAVTCSLSVERGSLPCLVRVESLVLCCGGPVLHRLGVSRAVAAPALAAAAADAWDVHITSTAASMATSPPLPLQLEATGTPLHQLALPSPAMQAAALGFAVFGSSWFESVPVAAPLA